MPINDLVPPIGLAEIKKVFGDLDRFVIVSKEGVKTLSPQFEHNFIVNLPLPFDLQSVNPGKRKIKRIRCHRLLAEKFNSVFSEIVLSGLQPKLTSCGGCFVFRAKRGGNQYSTHSWGIAIDLNPETNRQGTPGDMDSEIVAIFKRQGFSWGGDWRGKKQDPMHFQFCTKY